MWDCGVTTYIGDLRDGFWFATGRIRSMLDPSKCLYATTAGGLLAAGDCETDEPPYGPSAFRFVLKADGQIAAWQATSAKHEFTLLYNQFGHDPAAFKQVAIRHMIQSIPITGYTLVLALCPLSTKMLFANNTSTDSQAAPCQTFKFDSTFGTTMGIPINFVDVSSYDTLGVSSMYLWVYVGSQQVDTIGPYPFRVLRGAMSQPLLRPLIINNLQERITSKWVSPDLAPLLGYGVNDCHALMSEARSSGAMLSALSLYATYIAGKDDPEVFALQKLLVDYLLGLVQPEGSFLFENIARSNFTFNQAYNNPIYQFPQQTYDALIGLADTAIVTGDKNFVPFSVLVNAFNWLARPTDYAKYWVTFDGEVTLQASLAIRLSHIPNFPDQEMYYDMAVKSILNLFVTTPFYYATHIKNCFGGSGYESLRSLPFFDGLLKVIQDPRFQTHPDRHQIIDGLVSRGLLNQLVAEVVSSANQGFFVSPVNADVDRPQDQMWGLGSKISSHFAVSGIEAAQLLQVAKLLDATVDAAGLMKLISGNMGWVFGLNVGISTEQSSISELPAEQQYAYPRVISAALLNNKPPGLDDITVIRPWNCRFAGPGPLDGLLPTCITNVLGNRDAGLSPSSVAGPGVWDCSSTGVSAGRCTPRWDYVAGVKVPIAGADFEVAFHGSLIGEPWLHMDGLLARALVETDLVFADISV